MDVENIKDEFISIAAASIVSGYGKASLEFLIKVLAFIVAKNHGLDSRARKEFEDDVRWFVIQKLEEMDKKEG